MNFMKVFSVGNIVAGWLIHASADGKITALEIAELIAQVARVLEIDVDIDL